MPYCHACTQTVDGPCGYTACPLRAAALAHCTCSNLWLEPNENCLCIPSNPARAGAVATDPLPGGTQPFDDATSGLPDADQLARPLFSRLLHAAEIARA